jgi:hypothetical protein
VEIRHFHEVTAALARVAVPEMLAQGIGVRVKFVRGGRPVVAEVVPLLLTFADKINDCNLNDVNIYNQWTKKYKYAFEND